MNRFHIGFYADSKNCPLLSSKNYTAIDICDAIIQFQNDADTPPNIDSIVYVSNCGQIQKIELKN